MTALPNFQTDLWHNPVAWREIVGLGRGRGKWFWRGAYGLTALLVLMPVFYGHSYFARSLSDWLAVMALVYGALYILVGVRTVTAANDVITREKRGGTWELLMLTGVSTWRIVLGKWAGVMRVMARDYVWLYGLRLGIYVWASASMKMGYPYYDWQTRNALTIANAQFDGVFILHMAGLTALFLALELMLCAALGVLSGLLPWSARVGTGSAIAARVGVAAAIGFGILWGTGMIRPYPYTINYPDPTRMFITVVSSTLADNGALASILYSYNEDMNTEYYNYTEQLDEIALAQLIGMSFYFGLTLAALGAARYTARWQGVNETTFVPKAKPKRDYHETAPIAPAQVTETPIEQTPASALVSSPAPGTPNIFNLRQPEQYRVELFHYGRHLGRLILRAANGRETVYLQFTNVVYLDAPTQWQGAAFRTAKRDDYQALLRDAQLATNTLTAETTRLYVVETGEKLIRIVAGSAVLTYELNSTLTIQ